MSPVSRTGPNGLISPIDAKFGVPECTLPIRKRKLYMDNALLSLVPPAVPIVPNQPAVTHPTAQQTPPDEESVPKKLALDPYIEIDGESFDGIFVIEDIFSFDQASPLTQCEDEDHGLHDDLQFPGEDDEMPSSQQMLVQILETLPEGSSPDQNDLTLTHGSILV
jgi:hypothetical protein